MSEARKIQDNYENGECPDCGDSIPDEVVTGDGCSNCGHVFYLPEAKEACIHHWLLETPNGTTSNGTCKFCGTEQDFYNTPEDMREEGNGWMKERKGSWADKQRQDKLLNKGSLARDKESMVVHLMGLMKQRGKGKLS